MLLTSSQVSVAASCGIVLFFTAALFLSGCAIQQRTLRELRAAIKAPPAPAPKIFLPDRFRQATTELADGTVVALDGGGRRQTVVDITFTTLREGRTGDSNAAAAEPGDKMQKPISRAERRRRIREDIQKMAQGTDRTAYQRRLW